MDMHTLTDKQVAQIKRIARRAERDARALDTLYDKIRGANRGGDGTLSYLGSAHDSLRNGMHSLNQLASKTASTYVAPESK